MESHELQRLGSPNPQPRAFVYRNAESAIELPHPLRRRADVRAIAARRAATSALLQFRVYLRPE
jgi:hypothetical protein